MSSGKERARRYRKKLAAGGGRTLAFYIDGDNDKRLKELMAEHGLGQGEALKFCIELAYLATFEAPPDEAEPAPGDTTAQPEQLTLPGVESQATEATEDNTVNSNEGRASGYELEGEQIATPEPEPAAPYGGEAAGSAPEEIPTLEAIAKQISYQGGDAQAVLPKKMLARWVGARKAEGWTLRRMCAALNEVGIPTAKGKQWKPGGLDTFIRRYCNQ